ncbi:MAG: dTDP-4-dehydrorhamnose reductase [Pseudomonadota bacterium]
MRILQFGATGQVAKEMLRQATNAGVEITALSRDEANLTDIAAVRAAIATADAQMVVNCAAYTAVDQAEDDLATAFAVNAAAPIAMAQECAKRALPFIHISTDYVFSGSGTAPYTETDATGPETVYGLSKLAGEIGIENIAGAYVILRTAWVYGAEGHNFLRTMLRLGAERPQMRIVADQKGAPTHAGDIAQTILTLAPTLKKRLSEVSGVYHYSGDGETSWAQYARYIFKTAGYDTDVAPIATADYPTPAKRPANSVLNCNKIQRTFGIRPKDWRPRVASTVAEVLASPKEG